MPHHGGFREPWREAMMTATARQAVVHEDEIGLKLRSMIHRNDFDLAIVSAGQHGGGELSLGRAVKELLVSADCPVLVLGPSISPSGPARSSPATILHATDFSPQSLAAAQHAFSWAQEYEAWLTMLHVVEGVGAVTDHERRRSEELYRKWMVELVPKELPLWCEVDYRVSFGAAGPAIVQAARELHADLIVVGLSGLDGADAMRPGSTTEQVIRQAPCPVLVVREYMTKRAPLEFARDHRSRATTAVAA
jgi:nucleotide-binding universal stress UspA family protein